MTEDVSYWLEFGKVALAHAIAVVSPGPDFAVVLRQSTSYGRRTGCWTSAGIASAILLHVSYSLLGIGLLVRQSEVAFEILRWVGAGYLGWLGVQSLRAKRTPLNPMVGEPNRRIPTQWSAFATGFLTNALNPKAALFFVGLFISVISASTPKLIQAAYGLWMVLGTFAWFSALTILVTRPGFVRRLTGYGHWISRLLGVVLLALAASLLLSVGK
jgi:threonine/homoserine/homoserine lactone efflux protein